MGADDLAQQIDLERAPPVGDGTPREGAQGTDDARVVHQQIDRSQRALDLAESPVDRDNIGHIGGEGQRTAAGTLDQPYRLGQFLGRSRQHRDGPALRRQRLGEGAAQPAAAAGYDRHRHDALPIWTFAASVVAIQMPANTATRPTIRLSVIRPPRSCWASKAAAMGLTVMVLATRVGDARCKASTQRMNAKAPPAM